MRVISRCVTSSRHFTFTLQRSNASRFVARQLTSRGVGVDATESEQWACSISRREENQRNSNRTRPVHTGDVTRPPETRDFVSQRMRHVLRPCTSQWELHLCKVNGSCIPSQVNGCCVPAQVNGSCIPSQVNGCYIPVQVNGCCIPAKVNGYCSPAQVNAPFPPCSTH